VSCSSLASAWRDVAPAARRLLAAGADLIAPRRPRPVLRSLVTASQTYFKAASRRDKLEDAELAASNGKEKVLPVEALGLVMIHFGEGMGRGSEYGQLPPCTVREAGFGRAKSFLRLGMRD
jgi:hypothetical protein